MRPKIINRCHLFLSGVRMQCVRVFCVCVLRRVSFKISPVFGIFATATFNNQSSLVSLAHYRKKKKEEGITRNRLPEAAIRSSSYPIDVFNFVSTQKRKKKNQFSKRYKKSTVTKSFRMNAIYGTHFSCCLFINDLISKRILISFNKRAFIQSSSK